MEMQAQVFKLNVPGEGFYYGMSTGMSAEGFRTHTISNAKLNETNYDLSRRVWNAINSVKDLETITVEIVGRFVTGELANDFKNRLINQSSTECLNVMMRDRVRERGMMGLRTNKRKVEEPVYQPSAKALDNSPERLERIKGLNPHIYIAFVEEFNREPQAIELSNYVGEGLRSGRFK